MLFLVYKNWGFGISVLLVFFYKRMNVFLEELNEKLDKIRVEIVVMDIKLDLVL